MFSAARNFLILLIFVPIDLTGHAQLVDTICMLAYQAVFVAADGFKSVHLTRPEKAPALKLPNPLQLFGGNDMACYQPARNLDIAYIPTGRVLTKATLLSKNLWQGMHQVTETFYTSVNIRINGGSITDTGNGTTTTLKFGNHKPNHAYTY